VNVSKKILFDYMLQLIIEKSAYFVISCLWFLLNLYICNFVHFTIDW